MVVSLTIRSIPFSQLPVLHWAVFFCLHLPHTRWISFIFLTPVHLNCSRAAFQAWIETGSCGHFAIPVSFSGLFFFLGRKSRINNQGRLSFLPVFTFQGVGRRGRLNPTHQGPGSRPVCQSKRTRYPSLSNFSFYKQQPRTPEVPVAQRKSGTILYHRKGRQFPRFPHAWAGLRAVSGRVGFQGVSCWLWGSKEAPPLPGGGLGHGSLFLYYHRSENKQEVPETWSLLPLPVGQIIWGSKIGEWKTGLVRKDVWQEELQQWRGEVVKRVTHALWFPFLTSPPGEWMMMEQSSLFFFLRWTCISLGEVLYFHHW